MYIRNNVYPYSVAQLKQDNPQVSFPSTIPEELMAEYGMFPVKQITLPTVGLDKTVTEGQPKLVNGVWEQVWVTTNATNEEHLARVLSARANEYPSITDYLDGVVKGDQAQIQKYINDCLAVKAKYPKP
jgi:hypothetical protein